MKKIVFIGLVFLVFSLIGCAAYYPAKTEIKSFNNLNMENEKPVFEVVINKADETKISEETMNAIRNLILRELQNKNIEIQKKAPLLAKINITTYEEGDAALRALVGLGAGKVLIRATILVTQNGTVVLDGEIESETPTSLFNIYSGWPGTEQGVQETFAREVSKVLERLTK